MRRLSLTQVLQLYQRMRQKHREQETRDSAPTTLPRKPAPIQQSAHINVNQPTHQQHINLPNWWLSALKNNLHKSHTRNSKSCNTFTDISNPRRQHCSSSANLCLNNKPCAQSGAHSLVFRNIVCTEQFSTTHC